MKTLHSQLVQNLNKMSGSYSDVGCFSAHPLKNLNALGDAGYLVTNNNFYYKKIKDLCNHGMTDRDKIKILDMCLEWIICRQLFKF